MTYSLNDFKTGREVTTLAKKELWDLIAKKTFGGWDCACNTFESRRSNGTWLSYKINGMIGYIDELTGGDYGEDNKSLQVVAGTLARQFKVKFAEIKFLMCANSVYSAMDQTTLQPSTAQIKTKPEKKVKVKEKTKPNLDRAKIYSILSDICSKNLNKDELKFISEQLIIEI